jgi:hypothetical protein
MVTSVWVTIIELTYNLEALYIEGSVEGASCAFERVDTPRINLPIFLGAPLSLGVVLPVYVKRTFFTPLNCILKYPLFSILN